MKATIVSHSDADGVISASLIIKYLCEYGIPYIYFSSPSRVRDVICYSVMNKKELPMLYVLDIAANRQSIAASSIYEKAIWIDHHIWHGEIRKNLPENVEAVVDENASSCASVVLSYLGIDDRLGKIADEIDRNDVKSDDADFLRNLVGGIKFFYEQNRAVKLRKLAVELVRDFDGVKENAINKALVEKHREFIRDFDEKVKLNLSIFEIKGSRIAIYEAEDNLPVYHLYDAIKNHEKAPFDYIIALIHKKYDKKEETKLEFRTHNDKDVLSLAKLFGGGGHRNASGASVGEFLTKAQVIEKVSKLIR